jgi:hypothetical protein
VLSGSIGKIEIWEPTLYMKSGGDTETKRKRAKRILGKISFNTQLL